MQLPNKLFVKVDGSAGEEYLNPSANLIELVEMGEQCLVGTYQLIATQKCRGISMTTPVWEPKKPKRGKK